MERHPRRIEVGAVVLEGASRLPDGALRLESDDAVAPGPAGTAGKKIASRPVDNRRRFRYIDLTFHDPEGSVDDHLFRRSAVVAQLAVNQLVAGSNPAAGAILFRELFLNHPVNTNARPGIWPGVCVLP